MKGKRPATREFLQKQREDRKKQEELEAQRLDALPETPTTPSTPQKKYGAAAKAGSTGGVDMTAEFMKKVGQLKPFVEVGHPFSVFGVGFGLLFVVCCFCFLSAKRPPHPSPSAHRANNSGESLPATPVHYQGSQEHQNQAGGAHLQVTEQRRRLCAGFPRSRYGLLRVPFPNHPASPP